MERGDDHHGLLGSILNWLHHHLRRYSGGHMGEAAMTYDYIKRTYGVSPEPGKVVYHTVTKEWGVIKRENRSASHYVQVTFEGARHSVPCHPTELQYDVGRP